MSTDGPPKLLKLFTVSHVPAELAQAWLQHLRDFDIAHPGCHFEVGFDGPDMPLTEMVEHIRVEPELSFSKIFERVKWSRP